MALPSAFNESHRDILSTATHVITWQQSDLDQKRAKVVAAIADYRREEATLERLKRRTDETTQTLRNDISNQEAVLKAYKKDRAADLKRRADEHTTMAEKIAELACQKTEYETCRRQIDKEFASKQTARDKRFDADTAKQNKLNDEMTISERHHEFQRRLVTEKKNTYEKLERDSDHAKYVRDVLNEQYANQVVELLNRLPPNSWLVDQRGSSSTGKRNIRDNVVRMITSMTVNPGPWNKTEHWDSVNKSAHNQVSSPLFKVCVDLNIMITETSQAGVIHYVLHPEFLDQLNVKPRPRKFQKIQRWHLSRENKFLCTPEEREAEYQTHQTRRTAPLSNAKRKTTGNA